MAKVDIVVPIYNVEKYIKATLASLKNQTYQDIRILCIDDGSKDHSKDEVLDFIKDDERFIYFYKENGGLSDARNYGLKRATAPYIMFIDGDDQCEPQMVELSLNAILEDDSDMVIFPYYQLYSQTGVKEAIPMPFKRGRYSLIDNPEILAFLPNAAWNKLYKTSLFTKHDIKYPYGYRHQDLGTTPKLLYLAKAVSILEEPLYDYLIDRVGNITTKTDHKLTHILDMCKEICDYYKENNIFDTYKEELNYLCSINFINSLRKAMNMNDTEFVNQFIDEIFDFKKKYFKHNPSKYQIKENRNDFIYLHRFLTKSYYAYKRRKNG